MRGALIGWLVLLAPMTVAAQDSSDEEPAVAPPVPATPASPPKPTDEVAPPPPASTATSPSPDTIPNLPPPDVMYEGRIRASIAAAQSLQGPLDGRWVLATADGRELYMFQMVDKAGGGSPPEGVWRDLRRPKTPGDIGLIDSLIRMPGSLSVSFTSMPGKTANVTLKIDGAGAWSGKLLEDGVSTSVVMKRP